jgi:hypothetical protein
MKLSICTILICLIASSFVHSADGPRFSIDVVVPQRSDGERRIAYRSSGSEWDREAHFHVVIVNESDKPQRIWQENNSWGYFALSFRFVDEAGGTTIIKRHARFFSYNAPAFWLLEPNEKIVVEVRFEDPKDWDSFPSPSPGSKIVGSIQALLEISPTPASAKHGVWTGRVTSETRKVSFYRP